MYGVQKIRKISAMVVGLLCLLFIAEYQATHAQMLSSWQTSDYTLINPAIVVWHDRNGNGIRELTTDVGIVDAQVKITFTNYPTLTQVVKTGEHGQIFINDFGQGIDLSNQPYIIQLISLPNDESFNVTYEAQFADFDKAMSSPIHEALLRKDGAIDGTYTYATTSSHSSANLNLGVEFTPVNPVPVTYQIEEITISDCYDRNKATINVLVYWQGTPAAPIEVTLQQGTKSQIISALQVAQNALLIPTDEDGQETLPLSSYGWINKVSLQEVAFEVAADGVNGGILTIQSASDPASTIAIPFTAIPSCRPVACNDGQLGGAVFNDYNANGSRQYAETSGVDSITVTAIDVHDINYTTTTDNYGQYVLNIPSNAYPVRVEFTTIPAEPYLSTSTPYGDKNKSTVQFLSEPSCDVDLGVNEKASFCQDNPMVAMACVTENDQEQPVLTFSSENNATSIDDVVSDSSMGSIWGLAWDAQNQKLYQSAFLRRYADVGSLGLGGIYVADMIDGTLTSTPYLDVTTLGIDVGQEEIKLSERGDLSGESAADTEAFSLVGKVGLGGIDINELSGILYAVNLYDKQLYAFDTTISPPTNYTALPIPDNCVGGEMRPWALKSKGDKVYIGTICDGSLSQNGENVTASIYEYSSNNQSITESPILTFPLTYGREYPSQKHMGIYDAMWNPWQDDINQLPYHAQDSTKRTVVYPTPILSDIEFDVDGSMIIAFSDRTSFQFGKTAIGSDGGDAVYSNVAGGDLLRTYVSSEGMFLLEPNLKTGSSTIVDDDSIVSGKFSKEFYNDNVCSQGRCLYTENALGSIAFQPGSGKVIMAAANIMNGTESRNGIRYLSSLTGSVSKDYQLGALANNDNFCDGSAGLGDIELLCSIDTSVEIGNRIWLDLDGNGVQDPDESAISDVTLHLYDANGTVLASTTTDSDGIYLFDTTNGLLPNNDYFVVVDPAEFEPDGTLVNRTITESFLGTSLHDSNGVVLSDAPAAINNQIGVVVKISQDGRNDHTLDIGISPIPNVTLAIKTNLSDNENLTSHTYTIINSGETYLSAFTLTNDLGTPDDKSDDISLASSDCDDLLLTLKPNDTFTCTLTLSIPDGITNTTHITTIPSDETGGEIRGIGQITDEKSFFYDSPEQVATIGDYVFLEDRLQSIDASISDGLQNDDTDYPLEDIVVELYKIGSDTMFRDQSNRIGTTTTNTEGRYLFTKVEDGDYVIRFLVNESVRQLLIDKNKIFTNDKLQFTMSNVGSNDLIDSDVTNTISNSNEDNVIIGETNIFTINQNDDFSFDAGLTATNPTAITFSQIIIENDAIHDTVVINLLLLFLIVMSVLKWKTTEKN